MPTSLSTSKDGGGLPCHRHEKGDIATVVSVMTPEVIYAFYAADMIGASLNLVDPRYSAEGIHDYITEVDSHLLICLNVVYDRCQQAAKRTNVERVLVVSPADSPAAASGRGLQAVHPRQEPLFFQRDPLEGFHCRR